MSEETGQRSVGKRANEINAAIRYTMWSVFRLARPLGDDQRSAAADEVQALVDELAAEGLGVVLISSEFDEVVEGSDAIVVLREGRVVTTLRGADVNEGALLDALAEEP